MSHRTEAERRRIAVICPGRGSYSSDDLGSLSRPLTIVARKKIEKLLEATDTRRQAVNAPTLVSLDDASRLTVDHSAGEHVSPLTFACTAADYLRIDPELCRVVAVAGNSMGWYSALYCAGAMELDETMQLVETMSSMNLGVPTGGQLIYPTTDERWITDNTLVTRVDDALVFARKAGHRVGDSIHYGGYRVLWGDKDGLRVLRERLLPFESGGRSYPMHLFGHEAFHSPLLEDYARRATKALCNTIDWRPPRVPLIDGRGRQWSHLTTSTRELADYTLRLQVTETFNFTTCIRVILREFAPDLIVCLGPGDALSAPVAQVMIQENWQGINGRESFVMRQKIDPIVVSFGRAHQRQIISKNE